MGHARRGAAALLLTGLLAGCTPPSAGAGPASRPAPVEGGAWAPRAGLTWEIELSGPIGSTGDADVYDLDAFTATRDAVMSLRAAGKRVVCHVDVGVADTGRPDFGRYPAGVLGAPASATTRHIDIRDWDALAPILAARVQLCADKGFEAVDADATSTYLAASGFPLSASDQVAFDLHVVALARAASLGVAVRTPPALVGQIAPYADFAITGDCFARGVCDRFFPYIDRGKAVFDVESAAGSGYCGLARAYGFGVTRACAPA